MTIGNLPCPASSIGPSPGSFLFVGVIMSVIADMIISARRRAARTRLSTHLPPCPTAAGRQVSLNVTKYAHNKNQDPANPGKQLKPYTKLPLWWLAMVLNAGGELGNLMAKQRKRR